MFCRVVFNGITLSYHIAGKIYIGVAIWSSADAMRNGWMEDRIALSIRFVCVYWAGSCDWNINGYMYILMNMG